MRIVRNGAGIESFVAVLLADEKWTQQNIGFVLTVSGLAGLLSQLPGGELLDASRSKRFLVALGAIVVAISALVIALLPSPLLDHVIDYSEQAWRDCEAKPRSLSIDGASCRSRSRPATAPSSARYRSGVTAICAFCSCKQHGSC